jgi:hypothetical protein
MALSFFVGVLESPYGFMANNEVSIKGMFFLNIGFRDLFALNRFIVSRYPG